VLLQAWLEGQGEQQDYHQDCDDRAYSGVHLAFPSFVCVRGYCGLAFAGRRVNFEMKE
jgi:hypothetical protein